jgi:phosphoglycerate dehydrogenase-like enzyme
MTMSESALTEIAVTAASFRLNESLRQRAVERLAPHKVVFASDDDTATKERLIAFLRGKAAVIAGRETFDESVLTCLPELRVISKYGVGLDNVDLAAAERFGLEVLSSPGVNAFAVAEHTLGVALALFRNIAANDRLLHTKTWRKNGGRQLRGATVAIVGLGAVGCELAKLLRAFEVELLCVDILDKHDAAAALGGRQVSLAQALELSDLVTLHVPLTDATRHLLGSTHISMMKKGAFLINTSRGEVVDEAALKAALKSGHLAGAGLDVFMGEPQVDWDLVGLSQVVGTPHTAGNSDAAVAAMGSAAIENLRSFFNI